jgi:hypothetical protein
MAMPNFLFFDFLLFHFFDEGISFFLVVLFTGSVLAGSLFTFSLSRPTQ